MSDPIYNPSKMPGGNQRADRAHKPPEAPLKQDKQDSSASLSSPSRILQLQKIIGNQAVMQLLKSGQSAKVPANSPIQLVTKITKLRAGTIIIADRVNKVNIPYNAITEETKDNYKFINKYPLLKYTLKQATDTLKAEYRTAVGKITQSALEKQMEGVTVMVDDAEAPTEGDLVYLWSNFAESLIQETVDSANSDFRTKITTVKGLADQLDGEYLRFKTEFTDNKQLAVTALGNLQGTIDGWPNNTLANEIKAKQIAVKLTEEAIINSFDVDAAADG